MNHHRKNKLILSYGSDVATESGSASVSSLYGLPFITSAERNVVILHIALVSHAHWLTMASEHLEALYSKGEGWSTTCRMEDLWQAGGCWKEDPDNHMEDPDNNEWGKGLLSETYLRPSPYSVYIACPALCQQPLVDHALEQRWRSNWAMRVRCKLTSPAFWYPAFLLWSLRRVANFRSPEPSLYLLARLLNPFYLFTVGCRNTVL